MKTKAKDERNRVLKETKRAVQKGVQMWKAGGKGYILFGVRLGTYEGPMVQ